MVLDSVVTTSFAILLIFSLPSCLHLRAIPFSAEGVRAGASFPYSFDISPNTDSRSGYCTSTKTFHIMCAPSFSSLLDVTFVFLALVVFFLPQPAAPAHGRSREPTDARRRGYGASRSCSSCMPSRRTWRRLPRLGYLAMRSPRLRYYTTKARSVAAVAYATELVVVVCRFGGSSAVKILAFSRPSWTNAWCGCLSDWSCSGLTSFSACVLSPYISNDILPMSPLDAQVFVVSFSGNEQVCPPLPFSSCSTKPWKWRRVRDGVSDLLPMVTVRL
jgi:hypothetical protein